MFIASMQPLIPMSELIRKEFYFKAARTFQKAVGAQPAIFADEIRNHCLRFDNFFGTT
jgi:hypothetical protein